MSILLPIDKCDRCKQTIRNTDMVIVGETNGKHDKSWWKLCPKCNIHLHKKYVNANINPSKQAQSVLGMDTSDIKNQLNKFNKIWTQF